MKKINFHKTSKNITKNTKPYSYKNSRGRQYGHGVIVNGLEIEKDTFLSYLRPGDLYWTGRTYKTPDRWEYSIEDIDGVTVEITRVKKWKYDGRREVRVDSRYCGYQYDGDVVRVEIQYDVERKKMTREESDRMIDKWLFG